MTSALQLLPLWPQTKGPLRNIHIFPHAKLEIGNFLSQAARLVLRNHEKPVWWRGRVGEKQRFGRRGGHVCAWPKDWKQRPLSFWKKRNVFWSRHKHLASFRIRNQLMRWHPEGSHLGPDLIWANCSQEQHTGMLLKVFKCGRKSKQCSNPNPYQQYCREFNWIYNHFNTIANVTCLDSK